MNTKGIKNRWAIKRAQRKYRRAIEHNGGGKLGFKRRVKGAKRISRLVSAWLYGRPWHWSSPSQIEVTQRLLPRL